MQPVKEILEGYSDPQTRAVSPNPWGETGLTARIGVILYYQKIEDSMMRHRFNRFGATYFRDTFGCFLHTVAFACFTELLRVLDRKETRKDGRWVPRRRRPSLND